MKRRITIFGLSILSLGLIVGSGFSAWIFIDPSLDANKTINGTVSVTNGVEGAFKINPDQINFNLNFGQGGYDNKDDDNVGITVSFNGSSYTNDVINYNYMVVDYSKFDSYGLVISENYYSFEWGANTSPEIKNYLNLPTIPTSNQLVISEYSVENSEIYNNEISFKFTYKSNMKPKSKTEWETMNTLLSGAKLEIVVKANVEISKI